MRLFDQRALKTAGYKILGTHLSKNRTQCGDGARRFTGAALLILIALLALCSVEAALSEGIKSARLFIVLRQGALAPEETSPAGRSNASTLWSLALKGTCAATLESPSGLTAESSLKDIAKEILPKKALDVEGNELVLVDLAKPATTWSGASPAEAFPCKDLYKFVRPKNPIDSFEAARVVVIRVRSNGVTDEEVRGRDGYLAHLLRQVDDSCHLFVVNLPEEGRASLIAKGPSLRAGRILGRKRSFDTIRRAVEYLLREPGGRKIRHELFN